MLVRRAVLVAAAALGALLGTGPAAAVAHPSLVQAAPAPGLVTPKAPDAIRLVLSEPVVARGSSIEVRGPRGARIAVSSVASDGGGKALSVRPAKTLPPAVYRVRWSALGDDGHTVGGTFSFGVAGADGAPPPGAERLEGAAAGGQGGPGDAESVVSVAAEWLGLLGASFLFGGGLLLVALRRRDPDAATAAGERLGRLQPVAWLLLGLAVSEAVLARAAAGAGDSLDLGLLTGSATGRSELVRAAVVVLGAAAAARWPRAAVRIAGGGAVLLTYALSGHTLIGVGALELVAQAAHVLTAGLWLGGLVAVAVLGSRAAAATRAFAPLAGGALVVAVATGVLAAIREVDRWSLLRWSDYGNVVLVKGGLVALVGLAGFATWRRSRGAPAAAPRRVLLRLEVAGVLAVVALGAVLGGLSQGRGRPLPAQEGTILPGPAFGTALLPAGGAPVALAPARAGTNVLSVPDGPAVARAREVEVRLSCACAPEPVRAALRRGPGGTWSAEVRLPAEGPWYAYVAADGDRAASPVALATGVPRARGFAPRHVLALADLRGAGAARCRAHLLGLQLAVGRINGEGGVDGGRKLALRVVDDGGDRRRSARAAAAAVRQDRPLAVAGCGDGAAGGVAAAARAGVTAVVGDPAVGRVPGPRVFRTSAEPRAQGVALAQYVQVRVLAGAPSAVRTIRAAVQDPGVLAGLREGLAGTGIRVVRFRAAGRPKAQLRRILDRTRTLALVLDGPGEGGEDAAAVAELGREGRTFAPAPVLASSRVLSERLVEGLGAIGRVGAIQGVSEVSPQTADALAYARALKAVWTGERPSLDGLRGYVAGLALRFALRADDPADALREPDVFTDALLSPWPSSDGSRGSQALLGLAPQFLASNLVPPSAGGKRFEGTWFPDGAWVNASVRPLGPQIG